jgi:hypothetical protein
MRSHGDVIGVPQKLCTTHDLSKFECGEGARADDRAIDPCHSFVGFFLVPVYGFANLRGATYTATLPSEENGSG